MKKIILIVFIGLVILLGFTQLQNTNNKNEVVKNLIGVSLYSMEDQWQIEYIKQLEELASEMDDTVLITLNANSSAYKQIDDIENLVDYGVDMLIINPGYSLVTVNKIETLDLPVIVIDGLVENNDFTMYIGPDYFDIGIQMAKIVNDMDANINEEIEVIELRDFSKTEKSMLLNNGFDSNISENVSMKSYYLHDDSSNVWIEENIEMMEKFDVVICHNSKYLQSINKEFENSSRNRPFKLISMINKLDYESKNETLESDFYMVYGIDTELLIDNALKILESE